MGVSVPVSETSLQGHEQLGGAVAAAQTLLSRSQHPGLTSLAYGLSLMSLLRGGGEGRG